jgi:hypothetical protein
MDPSDIFHVLTLGKYQKNGDGKGLAFGIGMFLYMLAFTALIGVLIVKVFR